MSSDVQSMYQSVYQNRLNLFEIKTILKVKTNDKKATCCNNCASFLNMFIKFDSSSSCYNKMTNALIDRHIATFSAPNSVYIQIMTFVLVLSYLVVRVY